MLWLWIEHFIKDFYTKKGKQKEEANVMTSYNPSEVDRVYIFLDSNAKIVGEDCVSVIPFYGRIEYPYSHRLEQGGESYPTLNGRISEIQS